MTQGGGRHEEAGFCGQCQGEQVVPSPESDEDVDLHAVERLEIAAEEVVVGPKGVDGDGLADEVGRGECPLHIAEKHGGVHLEVDVVHPVGGVDPEHRVVGHVLVVGHDGGDVGRQRLFVLSAEDLDVRGHVHQVGGVGAQRLERDGLIECTLGGRRHLHDVDPEVKQTRVAMGLRPWMTFEARFEEVDRFLGARPFRGRGGS